MEKNLLGKVLGLSVSILGLLFFIYSLVSSYRELDENNITTIEVIGWSMVSLLIVPLIAYLSTKYLSKKMSDCRQKALGEEGTSLNAFCLQSEERTFKIVRSFLIPQSREKPPQ